MEGRDYEQLKELYRTGQDGDRITSGNVLHSVEVMNDISSYEGHVTYE